MTIIIRQFFGDEIVIIDEMLICTIKRLFDGAFVLEKEREE